MINNPQNFFDQVRNLCEELGLKMKAISESIAGFISKSEVEQDYLKKDEANASFLGKNAKAASASYADSAARATSADTATKAVQDADGATIATTYLKSTAAQSLYLGKTAKAESAKTADSATQDGNGKNIASTYATIASLTTTNTNVTNAQTTATQAKTSADAKVAISGNRGQLAGYETTGSVTTVSADSPDASEANSDITVAIGAEGTAWTKVVRVTGNVSVTLHSAWVWATDDVPEITSGGFLVLCWCGSGGVANFVSVEGK